MLKREPFAKVWVTIMCHDSLEQWRRAGLNELKVNNDKNVRFGDIAMTENNGQEQLNESISALVDGEASDMELRRIIKASESDDDVRKQWSRYQLISQVMQGEAPATARIDLSASIREAIDDEPEVKKGWFHNAARVAIAASVAGVVVMTAQLSQQQSITQEAQVASRTEIPQAVSPATLSLPAGFQAPSVAARTVSSEPVSSFIQKERQSNAVTQAPQIVLKPSTMPSIEVQQHIQEIMTLHANQAALNSNRGILPYARVPVRGVEEK